MRLASQTSPAQVTAPSMVMKRVFQQPARSLLGFAAKRSSSGGLGRLVGDLQPDSASGQRLPLADTRTSVDRGN